MVALGHLVQRLPDVPQVGEPALPAHFGKDPPRQAAGRGGLEDGRDPAAAEHLDPRAQPVGDLVSEVVAADVELDRGVPEEAGQRRRRTRALRCGCSRASSNDSQSTAAAVANTLPPPAITAGTPTSARAPRAAARSACR